MVASAMIVLMLWSMFVRLCKRVYRRLINGKYKICKSLVKLRKVRLNWWFCTKCKPPDALLKLCIDESIAINTSCSKDLKTPIKLSFNDSIMSEDETHLNYMTPPSGEKKNNRIAHSKNNLSTSLKEMNNIQKHVCKKMMQNDVSTRLELLETKQQLFKKINQVKELDRKLREARQENSSILCLSNFNNTSLIRTPRIQPRRTYFNSTANSSFRNLSFWEKGSMENDDLVKMQLNNLKKLFEKMKDDHINELVALQDKLEDREEELFKLKQMIKKELEKLTNQIQDDYDRLKRDQVEKIAQLQDLIQFNDNHEQNLKNVNNLDTTYLKNNSSMSDIQEEKSLEDALSKALNGYKKGEGRNIDDNNNNNNNRSDDHDDDQDSKPGFDEDQAKRRVAKGARIAKPIRGGQRPSTRSANQLQQQ